MTNPILAWGPLVVFFVAAAAGSLLGFVQFLSL